MERIQILTMGFVVLTAFSAISMVETTRNYLSFFPTVQNLSARLSEIQVNVASDNSSITLDAVFEFQNPRDYEGLSVAWYQVDVAFKEEAEDLVRFGSLPFDGRKGELAPRTPIDGFVYFEVPGPIGATLAKLHQSGRLVIAFNVLLGLSTFMNDIAGLAVQFSCLSNGEPADCEILAPRVRYRFAGGPSVGA